MNQNKNQSMCLLFFFFVTTWWLFKFYEKCFLFRLKKCSFRFQCITFFPSFPLRQQLLEKMIEDISQKLRRHQLAKQEFKNTYCLISWEGKKVWYWNFINWVLNKKPFYGSIFNFDKHPKTANAYKNSFKYKIFRKMIIKTLLKS